MQENPLRDSIEDLEHFKKVMEEATGKTSAVKDGVCTPEEEKKDPSYILYNGIADNTIAILQLPLVAKTFEVLSEKLGDDATKSLVEMLALIMTHSAYSALTTYDSLLKKELTDQFDHMVAGINSVSATVNGVEGAVQILKQRLEEMTTSKISKAVTNADSSH